jgi:hypothetical protein
MRLMSWVLFLLLDFSFKFGSSSFALVANMVALIIIAVFVRSEKCPCNVMTYCSDFFLSLSISKEGHSLTLCIY